MAVSAPTCHYVVVRTDLPHGVICAQIVHAAGETGGNLPKGTIAIALSAEDEESLLSIEKKLIQCGVPHIAVREPDAPFFGALMAIGVCPGPKSKLKKLFSNLPLIK